jgi:hypothetical protein
MSPENLYNEIHYIFTPVTGIYSPGVTAKFIAQSLINVMKILDGFLGFFRLTGSQCGGF